MISRFVLNGKFLLNVATNQIGRSSNNISQLDCRFIHVGSIRFVKEIKISETKDEIVVEALKIPSDRTDNLVPMPKGEQEKHAYCSTCPLCRLNLRNLNYSDTLILQQFIESNGRMMFQPVTGLCTRSYKKVEKLIKQAQISRLLPRPPEFELFGPWQNLNTYFEFPKRPRDQPMRVVKKEYWK